jgi:formylglycine-generating enzyme required for sulfatase activity
VTKATTFRGHELTAADIARGTFIECTQAFSEDTPGKKISKNCPEMVVIPDGIFVMGSSDGKTPVIGLDGKEEPKPKARISTEGERQGDEGPQHTVSIKRFAVSKYLVTAEQWAACVSARACKNPGSGQGTDPIFNVNWHDAQEYVAWLSRMTGREYRLLSEAEFEYAARANSTTRYSWGDRPMPEMWRASLAHFSNGSRVVKPEPMANCNGCGSEEWNMKKVSPVGTFKPNKFGLHDMYGNVWEWLEDTYHDNYKDAPKDGSAWIYPTKNIDVRVLRGGAWNLLPGFMRSARRYSRHVDDRWTLQVGFRVARTLANP